MMTPDSISSKRFDKAMGGYRQDDVDAFLRQVAQELASLQEENRDLEKKVEVLAGRIEEYRADEDSLRSALIGAQKLADSVIREAKAKAENILLDARAEANSIRDDAKKNVEIEQTALVQMRKEVGKFKNRMLALYRQHLELLTELPDYAEEAIARNEAAIKQATAASAPAAEAVKEEPVEKAEPAAPGEDVVLDFSGMSAAPSAQAAEPAPKEEPALGFSELPSPSADSASKFGPLKFGEGFDVERDEKAGMFGRKKHH